MGDSSESVYFQDFLNQIFELKFLHLLPFISLLNISITGVNMFGELFIRNPFFFDRNHLGNCWKYDGADRDGDDALHL